MHPGVPDRSVDADQWRAGLMSEGERAAEDQDRLCIAAIEAYRSALDRILGLASQRADDLDADERRSLAAAQVAFDEAERAIWPFVKDGTKPPVYDGVAYLPGMREGTIRAVPVSLLAMPRPTTRPTGGEGGGQP
jgi:hypothetical protein